jgi:hypothetical protein
MPTGNVSTTHVSGGLGTSGFIPDRVHAKIGIAEDGVANEVKLILNFQQAKQVFKAGPLVDSLQQHFEEFDANKNQIAGPVLCIRPVNDIPGIATAIPDEERTGLATFVVEGNPTGSADVVIKIVLGGKSGVATYKKSIDGGVNWESVLQTPASGSALALANGSSVKFTDDSTTPDSTFVSGETYKFQLTRPTASPAEILNSLNLIKREYRLYWIHILGGVDKAFGVSVSQILNEMEVDHHLPTFAILEAIPPVTDLITEEDVGDYHQALIDEWESFKSDRVSIVPAWGRYIPGGIFAYGGIDAVKSSAEPVGYWVNAATMLCAKLAASPVNVSPGYVRVNQSLTISEIKYWSLGYRNYMDVLNDSGFTVLKEYDDYEGIFIAQGKIKARSDSDFQEIPERRRADKLHRIVYKASLPFIEMDSEVKSGSGGLEYVRLSCSADVSSEMEVAGRAEISGHTVILDPNKNFITTGILEAYLTMYVKNRVKAISWTTSFSRI